MTVYLHLASAHLAKSQGSMIHHALQQLQIFIKVDDIIGIISFECIHSQAGQFRPFENPSGLETVTVTVVTSFHPRESRQQGLACKE